VFSDIDEELLVGLAAAAAIAIQNVRLQTKFQGLALVEDRARIARDLPDTVIQRLFATGPSLQSTSGIMATDAETALARIDAAVDDLDLTVKHIRSAMFGLESPRLTMGGLLYDVGQLAIPTDNVDDDEIVARPATWASAASLEPERRIELRTFSLRVRRSAD